MREADVEETGKNSGPNGRNKGKGGSKCRQTKLTSGEKRHNSEEKENDATSTTIKGQQRKQCHR